MLEIELTHGLTLKERSMDDHSSSHYSYLNKPVLQSQPDFIYLLTSYHRCHRWRHFIVYKTDISNSVSQNKKTNPVKTCDLFGQQMRKSSCSAREIKAV